MKYAHRHLIRVRFPEVDTMGWVHHGVYLVWFEIGRTEMLRAVGLPYSEVMAAGIHFPVVEVGCRYRHPIRYDRIIAVETTLASVTPIQIRLTYRILDPASGTLHAEGFTRHAVVNQAGRLTRMPEAWLKVMKSVCAAELEHRLPHE